jgi:glyoxylase-like metal-dependent hydrolase (beta-lactamase superfamily II)
LTLPGIRVAPFRTPTLPPATHTNLVILGEGELLVVDPATPYPDERAGVDSLLDELVDAGHRLKAIFLTHHHADHVGDAARLSQDRALPIWAHEKTADLAGLSVDRFFDEGEVLELGGTQVQNWTILHTPGHAAGHLCLHERTRGVLVAGDMIAAIGTILIDPDEGHMGTYLKHLERLVNLNPKAVIPAHGPLITEGSKRLKETLAHRRMRQEQVLAALPDPRARSLSPLALVPGIYQGAIPEAVYPLAARSVQSALTLLVEEGRAVETAGGYRQAPGVKG